MMTSRFKEFIPKSITCLRDGYSKDYLFSDLFAGISVGVIALPLALAFAIASGVNPEQGLFTAIVAGFLISLLGGSRVQIGGPTGAYVIIVYAVMQEHGYNGLALATLIASFMLIIMGIARLGWFLKFIPYPVTTGFTTGIAVVIVSLQVKDFFGLEAENVPSKFIEKCNFFCQIAHTWNLWAVVIALFTLVMILLFRHLAPRWPGAITAIILATAAAYYFDLPIESIHSKFGDIPRSLPSPSLPVFSYDLFKKVFPDAITIALLGAIESLLSAVVADGMTGHKHRSNMELVAQGFANIGSVIFGGIPATGAIARTAANINMGAKTPMAGMFHAVTLFLIMYFLAPYAGMIPLATLAAVLVFVAWNMSELPHFIEILKGQKGDAIVLLTTFLLTVLVDLAAAVQVGVLLAPFLFLKRMSDRTSIEISRNLLREIEEDSSNGPDEDLSLIKYIPEDVIVFQINGPFFYGVADILDEVLIQTTKPVRAFILRLNKTPLIDATGLQSLKQFSIKCRKRGILFLISDIDKKTMELFRTSGVEEAIGKTHLCEVFDAALEQVR